MLTPAAAAADGNNDGSQRRSVGLLAPLPLNTLQDCVVSKRSEVTSFGDASEHLFFFYCAILWPLIASKTKGYRVTDINQLHQQRQQHRVKAIEGSVIM